MPSSSYFEWVFGHMDELGFLKILENYFNVLMLKINFKN